jgi:hypothetical protein
MSWKFVIKDKILFRQRYVNAPLQRVIEDELVRERIVREVYNKFGHRNPDSMQQTLARLY